MGWKGMGVKLSYDNASILPADDSFVVDYATFKKRFGEDGSVIVIGVENSNMFQLKEFNHWYDLTADMSKIEGVEGVMSITKAAMLQKNDSLHQFEFNQLVPSRPVTQSSVDSLKNKILSQKFYDGLLFNSKTDVYILAITLKKAVLNDKVRMTITDNIVDRAKEYTVQSGHELHYSGLPYIRTVMARTVQHELFLFVMLSIIIAAFILYLFFRSFKVVLSSLVVVGISIVFTLGLVGLFGFQNKHSQGRYSLADSGNRHRKLYLYSQQIPLGVPQSW